LKQTLQKTRKGFWIIRGELNIIIILHFL